MRTPRGRMLADAGYRYLGLSGFLDGKWINAGG